VQKILPLLKEDFDIKYHVDCYADDKNPGQVGNLMKMLAPKTKELFIWLNDFDELSEFNQQFPNFIMAIPSICVFQCISDVDSLAKWLVEPREDGKPKLLKFYYDGNKKTVVDLIDHIKEVNK